MSSTATAESRTQSLIEALPYIQKFRGKTFVIKYGGAAMDEDLAVERLLRDIVFLEAVGINPVLVHGGGKAITARMREAGLPARFVNGLRVTDAATIGIVESTLDGEVNPRLVAAIERFGGRALGLSGRQVFVATRLPLQRDGEGEEIDIGYVGEAAGISADAVRQAIHGEIVPVISPVGATADGTPLNINADLAAAALAAELRATKLIYLSDVAGIMRDPSVPDSLIPAVSAAGIEMLVTEKIIAGGMIPKVQSAVSALQKGVEKIHFIGGTTPHALLLEIFTDAGVGTEIVL